MNGRPSFPAVISPVTGLHRRLAWTAETVGGALAVRLATVGTADAAAAASTAPAAATSTE
jgi:hypothetical protein